MRTMTRRDFMDASAKLMAAAPLAGALSALPGCTPVTQPNILILMVDQMRTPPEGYADDEGTVPELREILGFLPLSEGNSYAQYFPGLLRLRQNAVVMRKHYTASAACVPSRAAIMTGQYPCATGVTQTDGNYKSVQDVPFLDPAGTPTIGDWFRAAGYSTHYFGKWHVSEPEAPAFLNEWGFDDWDESAPEPHGGTASNLGVYRDIEFTDAIRGFFDKKADEKGRKPWLAVGSLVNPHDISAYPINWMTPNNTGVQNWNPYPPATSIPAEGDVSNEGGINETNTVALNPDGFPQDSCTLPRTYSETLEDKPRCQYEYSLKWGLAMGANANYGLPEKIRSPQPFQLQGENAEAWSLGYNQFYMYCHYLADLQLRRILEGLDKNGLAENTIVVFLSDHGEMGGAHGGMIQKWHNAYEETVRVPMIFSSPLLNADAAAMREIPQPTSSIDLAPTLLGLAGANPEELRRHLRDCDRVGVKPFPGADLTNHILGVTEDSIEGPGGMPRPGVFFMTNDTITEIGPAPTDPKPAQYQGFLASVETQRDAGLDLASGPVCQPNNVHAFCTGDWKIVRYTDPNGVEADEWELYCLTADPVEAANLVDFATGLLREDAAVDGMSRLQLETKHDQLRTALAQQEIALFGAAV